MLTADEREELDEVVEDLSRYRKALVWYDLMPAKVYAGAVGVLVWLGAWVLASAARLAVAAAGASADARWWSIVAIAVPTVVGLLAAYGTVRGIARFRIVVDEKEQRRQELRTKEWATGA